MSTLSSSASATYAGVDTTSGGRSLFLAYANPNYTAQVIMASIWPEVVARAMRRARQARRITAIRGLLWHARRDGAKPRPVLR